MSLLIHTAWRAQTRLQLWKTGQQLTQVRVKEMGTRKFLGWWVCPLSWLWQTALWTHRHTHDKLQHCVRWHTLAGKGVYFQAWWTDFDPRKLIRYERGNWLLVVLTSICQMWRVCANKQTNTNTHNMHTWTKSVTVKKRPKASNCELQWSLLYVDYIST